jgi:hypothetical protein
LSSHQQKLKRCAAVARLSLSEFGLRPIAGALAHRSGQEAVLEAPAGKNNSAGKLRSASEPTQGWAVEGRWCALGAKRPLMADIGSALCMTSAGRRIGM